MAEVPVVKRNCLRGKPKLAHFHINKPNVDMKHMKTGIQIIEKGQERKNLQNKKFAVPATLVHSRTLCRERCLLTLFQVSVLFFIRTFTKSKIFITIKKQKDYSENVFAFFPPKINGSQEECVPVVLFLGHQLIY